MNCKNCKESLEDSYDYCNNCGAKVIRNRLTIRNLFEHFIDQFLSIDNKLLQTFITLSKKPEKVIGDYINGTRKKYVNVISYVAIGLTVSGLYIFVLSRFFPDLMSASQPFGVENPSEAQIKLNNEILNATFDYQGLIFFLTIPFLAVISRIVFLRNKKYNFTEHLVINLYAYSHISIITSVVNIILVSIGASFTSLLYSFPLMILYFAYVLKKMYGLSILQIILKTLLFFLLMIPVFILFMIVILVVMFLTGSIGELLEAEKLKKGVSYIISSAINWTS